MKRLSLVNLVIVLLAVSPMLFLAIIWNKLPEIVPVHYDIHFNPDTMGSKNTLWMMDGMLSFASLFVYFLLRNLHRIDPKRRKQPPSPSFNRIAIVIVAFITALNFLVLLSINNNIKLSQKWLFALLGLLMAFIGNYMNNLKPNYFAGFRLPWTLSSDDNWKKTHHIAGKIWFWGGLSLVLITFLIPPDYSITGFFIILGVMIFIPVIYSYRLFKQEK